MHEELEELILEHGLFHVLEHLVERGEVLLHGRRRIEPVISAKADRHLELGATLGIAEDSPEVLLGREHQLQHLIGPVAEHQEQQLVIVLVPHLL